MGLYFTKSYPHCPQSFPPGFHSIKEPVFCFFQQDIDKIYRMGQKENRIVFGDIKRKNGELCMKTDLLFHKSVEKRALAGKALADRKKAV